MNSYPASPESQDRTKARRFTGEPVTAFGNLHPIFAGIAAQHGMTERICPLCDLPADSQCAFANCKREWAEPRSIADLAEDHLYQRQEMEDADERAGLE